MGNFALLLKRLRPRDATLSQKYFLDKRCESFFSCSLSADSSLCTGDQPWSSRGVHHPGGSQHQLRKESHGSLQPVMPSCLRRWTVSAQMVLLPLLNNSIARHPTSELQSGEF